MKKLLLIASVATLVLACNSENKETTPETKKDTLLPTANADTTKREDVVVARTINAPVEKVWKAWTDPKEVIKWWGPRFYTTCETKIDFREGGNYVFCMQAPKDQGGEKFFTSGVYNKIVPNQLIEMTQGLSDKDGNRIDPATKNMPPDFPKDIRTTLVFKETADKKAELTVTEYDWKVGQMRTYSEQGMRECLDKLAELFK